MLNGRYSAHAIYLLLKFTLQPVLITTDNQPGCRVAGSEFIGLFDAILLKLILPVIEQVLY